MIYYCFLQSDYTIYVCKYQIYILETCDPFPGQHLPITVKIKVLLLSMFSLIFPPCFFVILFSFMLSLLVMPSLFCLLFLLILSNLYTFSLGFSLLSFHFYFFFSPLLFIRTFFSFSLSLTFFSFIFYSLQLSFALYSFFLHSPFYPVSYNSFPPSFSFPSIASIKRLASYSNNHSMHLYIDRCLFLVE